MPEIYYFYFTDLSVMEMCFNQVLIEGIFPLLKRMGRSMSHFHYCSWQTLSWLKLPHIPS